MISARGRLHVGRRAWQRCQAVLLRVARQTPRPLCPCWPVSAEAINLAVGPASNPFPSGLLPSGLGMAMPTIPQARLSWSAMGRHSPGDTNTVPWSVC